MRRVGAVCDRACTAYVRHRWAASDVQNPKEQAFSGLEMEMNDVVDKLYEHTLHLLGIPQ